MSDTFEEHIIKEVTKKLLPTVDTAKIAAALSPRIQKIVEGKIIAYVLSIDWDEAIGDSAHFEKLLDALIGSTADKIKAKLVVKKRDK